MGAICSPLGHTLARSMASGSRRDDGLPGGRDGAKARIVAGAAAPGHFPAPDQLAAQVDAEHPVAIHSRHPTSLSSSPGRIDWMNQIDILFDVMTQTPNPYIRTVASRGHPCHDRPARSISRGWSRTTR